MKVGKRETKLILVMISLFLFLSVIPTRNIMMVDERLELESLTALTSDSRVIVIDYSHGQKSSQSTILDDDELLGSELEAMGYTVIWATGGLNSSVLSGANGLLIASILSEENAFLSSEIDAIDDWFGDGFKFLWIGCDSDYTSLPNSGQFINDNMSEVLEVVGSHVYPEPASVEDAESNAGAGYRVIANQTSDEIFVTDIVNDVENVLMHGPTLVYGSNNDLSPGVGIDPVALESTEIDDVFPLLYYSEFARVVDGDLTTPFAHYEGEIGGFVATTMEINAGVSEDGVIVVSGASPYADYRSMHITDYYDKPLNGNVFVLQVIDFGMKQQNPSIDEVPDVAYEEGVVGNQITWYPHSVCPQSYNITSDGTLVREGLWNSTDEAITVNVDYLMAGPYTYTLTVTDYLNFSASNSVFVTVYSPEAPIITSPSDISYTLGQVGNEIVWEVSDTSLLNYILYLNGTPFYTSSEPLNSSISVILVVDGLSVGHYNYTINVYDFLGLSSADSVIVEVVNVTTTTPTTTTSTTTNSSGFGFEDLLGSITFLISIGAIVVIVTVVVLIRKFRN